MVTNGKSCPWPISYLYRFAGGEAVGPAEATTRREHWHSHGLSCRVWDMQIAWPFFRRCCTARPSQVQEFPRADPLDELLGGRIRCVEYSGGQVIADCPRPNRVYLSGSFNPLHEGASCEILCPSILPTPFSRLSVCALSVADVPMYCCPPYTPEDTRSCCQLLLRCSGGRAASSLQSATLIRYLIRKGTAGPSQPSVDALIFVPRLFRRWRGGGGFIRCRVCFRHLQLV